MRSLAGVATPLDYLDGQVIFTQGTAELPFYVVESGWMRIINPMDGGRTVVEHGPGEFAGDIDLLTQRPVIVGAVARGPTRLLCVPNDKLRELLNTVPRLSDKLLVAFQVRRELLKKAGVAGIKVIGPGHCRDTNVVREFLHKNFVPFTWYDMDTPEGRAELGGGGVAFEDAVRRLRRRYHTDALPHAPGVGPGSQHLARVSRRPPLPPGRRGGRAGGHRRRGLRRLRGTYDDRARPRSAPAGRPRARPGSRTSSASPPACPAPTWPPAASCRCSSSAPAWSPR